MVKRIAITGVESTGKSILTQTLALQFNGTMVAEYARTYLQKIATNYTIQDVENIAMQQLDMMQKALATAPIFYDTEMFVCKIWCEVKFNNCGLKILNACNTQEVDAFIIPDIDLPWHEDTLRELPNIKDRQALMQYYIEHVVSTNKPFVIVKGLGNQRTEEAIEFVKKMLLT